MEKYKYKTLKMNDLPFIYPLLDEIKLVRAKAKQQGIELFEELNDSLSDDIMATCPNEDHDETRPSWGINKQTGEHNCFACGFKGNFLHFIAYMHYRLEGEKISREQAYNALIKEFYEDDSLKTSMVAMIENITKKEGIWVAPTEEEIKAYTYEKATAIEYLAGRGFTELSAEDLNWGYRQEHNSLTVPAYDVYSKPAFITERFITPINDIRYYYPPEAPKLKHIYLLNEIVNNREKEIVITEGYLDAAWLRQHGVPAVAIFGTVFSEYHRKLLIRAGIRRVIEAFDNDEPGRKAAKMLNKALGDKMMINKVKYPKGVNDPQELLSSDIYSLEIV